MAAPNMLSAGSMSTQPDYETWLIEAGDGVIERKANFGVSSLSDVERLIYCLWVADYGMRNAGDLDTAYDLYPAFQAEGLELATRLSMPRAKALFEQPRHVMSALYFINFEGVCEELAKRSDPPARSS
jgi:hypothetical protein